MNLSDQDTDTDTGKKQLIEIIAGGAQIERETRAECSGEPTGKSVGEVEETKTNR